MYRPLTFLSYWVDYRLFGNHLWAYHLQSIAFHILNALLVAALAVELGFSGDVPRLSAALFGLAAVHFEPVLWPAARFDLISCAFTLMSFLFFLKYCRQDRRSTVWLPLTVLTFVAGVLNKETSYSVLLLVPALLLSFRFWNLGKLSAKNAALALGLLFASGACLVGVRFAVLGGIGSYGFRDPSAPPHRRDLEIDLLASRERPRFAGFQRECDHTERPFRIGNGHLRRDAGCRRLFLQRCSRSKTAPPVWFRGTECRSGHRCDRMDQPIAPAHQARVSSLGLDRDGFRRDHQ